ncbi:hypothetical protein HY024_02575, partial [Candidatus Curtissbacteria bacterium]|nr:hypothetical protein [Candidatus Curtissbacteria bacterium]
SIHRAREYTWEKTAQETLDAYKQLYANIKRLEPLRETEEKTEEIEKLTENEDENHQIENQTEQSNEQDTDIWSSKILDAICPTIKTYFREKT